MQVTAIIRFPRFIAVVSPVITVDGVYGKQEGAEVGYNPHKKGQKAYHPLMAFIAETKEVLHSWFRCGSAYTSNGVVEFMKECMAYMNKG